MAIPDIFSDDPPTERLASYFEELYEYLVEQGVPEECLPSPWHVLRRVTKAIDQELLREWLDAYSAVESEIEDDEDDDSVQDEESQPKPRGKKRPRPSYLRALETDPDPDPDPKGDRGHNDGEAASGEEGS